MPSCTGWRTSWSTGYRCSSAAGPRARGTIRSGTTSSTSRMPDSGASHAHRRDLVRLDADDRARVGGVMRRVRAAVVLPRELVDMLLAARGGDLHRPADDGDATVGVGVIVHG